RMFVGRPAAPWSDWAIVAVALATLPLAARSVRNTAPFILFAVPAASRLCGAALRLPPVFARLFRREPRPASPDKPRLNLAILSGMAVLALAIVGLAYATNHDSLAWRPIGDGAL